MPIVREALANLDDIIQDDTYDLSRVASFTIWGKAVSGYVCAWYDTSKVKGEREKIEILLDDISDLNASSVE